MEALTHSTASQIDSSDSMRRTLQMATMLPWRPASSESVLPLPPTPMQPKLICSFAALLTFGVVPT